MIDFDQLQNTFLMSSDGPKIRGDSIDNAGFGASRLVYLLHSNHMLRI